MADSKKTLQDIKTEIEAELKKQRDSKAEIKKAQLELRDLRQKKADIASERAKNEETIRDLQIQLAEWRGIVKDSDSSEATKQLAQERMQDTRIEMLGTRKNISQQDAQISGINTKVQRSLGSKEFSESMLSTSRTQSRETVSRGRMMEAVDSLTPRELKSNLSKNIAPDTQLEAMRSGEAVRKMGGTRTEQQQAQQATSEFAGLFAAIKETKKALAGLTQGTEEHTKKQEELSIVEGEATEALTRLAKVERDVEKRKLSGVDGPGGSGASGMSRAGSIMGQAGQFGNNLLSSLGPMATDRYVMEEQKKQARLSLSNMSLTDLRNSTTDATSFLSTGGGSMFGAETPFEKNGGVNRGIKGLGEDYANTQRAIPQAALAMRTMQGAGTALTNIAGDTAMAAGINPITGAPIAGTGSALKHLGQFGVNSAMDAATTAEFGAGMGGAGAAETMIGVNNTVIGGMTQFAQGAGGSLISQGGGNGDQMVEGIGQFGSGANKAANGMLNIGKRGYEAVDEREALNSTEQQMAQAGRVRDRLGMAYAPAMQQYMDTMPTMKATMRSSNMSRGQREGYERDLETFSTDGDLGERGFGVNEILGNNMQASQRLGRFGAGGMNQRVAKSGMMAESMGLGSAQQSIQAMGAMKAGGADDPEALFTKAVKEGLMRGLQDSRQFQGLLDAAVSSADSSSGFEGTLSRLIQMTGSGRANDVQTAKAGLESINKDMSGFSGDWTDMVKYDITNSAGNDMMKRAESKGRKFDDDDRTTIKNLANFKPDDLKNTELVRNSLTPNAREAIEEDGGLDKYLGNINTSIKAHGQNDRAINSTQSPLLAKVRNLLKMPNGEGHAELKKMFEGPEGKKQLDKILALNMSGQSSNNGNMDAAQGLTQGMAGDIGAAIGMDTQEMGIYQKKYERKDLKTAEAESAAARTGEMSSRGTAQISQTNMRGASSVVRNADGSSNFADSMANVDQRYQAQTANQIKNTANERTVEPVDKVERLDSAIKEMVEGLKKMGESLKGFNPEKMVVNASGEILIQGAAAVKGVMLDNALTQAASAAGSVIVDKINSALSGNSKDSTSAAPKSNRPAGSVPAP